MGYEREYTDVKTYLYKNVKQNELNSKEEVVFRLGCGWAPGQGCK